MKEASASTDGGEPRARRKDEKHWGTNRPLSKSCEFSGRPAWRSASIPRETKARKTTFFFSFSSFFFFYLSRRAWGCPKWEGFGIKGSPEQCPKVTEVLTLWRISNCKIWTIVKRRNSYLRTRFVENNKKGHWAPCRCEKICLEINERCWKILNIKYWWNFKHTCAANFQNF